MPLARSSQDRPEDPAFGPGRNEPIVARDSAPPHRHRTRTCTISSSFDEIALSSCIK